MQIYQCYPHALHPCPCCLKVTLPVGIVTPTPKWFIAQCAWVHEPNVLLLHVGSQPPGYFRQVCVIPTWSPAAELPFVTPHQEQQFVINSVRFIFDFIIFDSLRLQFPKIIFGIRVRLRFMFMNSYIIYVQIITV